jgi:FkbM family methyltransferase
MTRKEQLEHALDYAAQTGSFHRRNLVEQADHVCVYGLGKYFEDAFIRQNVRERFRVDLLCDGNAEKIRSVTARPEYAGLQGVTINELPDYGKVYVIVMLGNPTSAMNALGEIIGIENCAAYNDVALDDVVSRDEKYRKTEYFTGQRDAVFQAFDLLEDEKSREIFVNVICNRIAPQFSTMTYAQMCQKPQYFPQDVWELTDHECVVDGGAYTGDTLESFLEICKGHFDTYHAFEMDEENCGKLKQVCARLDEHTREKIHCHQKGLWNCHQMLSYGRNSSDDSYSLYNSEDTAGVETVRLDEYLGKERITLIKMDIEGSEWNALNGGAGIIAEQKPKMAICVYHRLEDIWKIPLYLKSLVPEYKIAIRHHAEYWVSETVCYAYVK